MVGQCVRLETVETVLRQEADEAEHADIDRIMERLRDEAQLMEEYDDA